MEWTGARYADSPTVTASTRIAAEPERVWAVVSDIAVMPALSDELQAVEWTDGAAGPALGAAFLGHNRHPSIGEWTSRSQIIACDRPRAFAWSVGDPDAPAATWGFALTPESGDPVATTLTYTAQLGPGRSGLSLAIEAMPEKEQTIVFVRLREFETALTNTLAAIKRLAEGPAAAKAD
ncbi:MAG TPA: SRPBCC family protein [Mycobacterium sp.]|nr:SRPBCC family protein [Mycobacterium sp.]